MVKYYSYRLGASLRFPSPLRSAKVVFRLIYLRQAGRWYGPMYRIGPAHGLAFPVSGATGPRGEGDDMAGKFELYQDKAGKYRFRLKAGNGQIIAVGEAYETKAAAQKGIESVKTNAGDASVVEVTS